MKRLFISQPMRTKTEQEILKERNRFIEEAKRVVGEDLEVIDSYFQDYPSDSTKNKGLWYLGKSLILLATADYVYFGDGWDEFRGCKIEHLCAEEYGIQIIHD